MADELNPVRGAEQTLKSKYWHERFETLAEEIKKSFSSFVSQWIFNARMERKENFLFQLSLVERVKGIIE